MKNEIAKITEPKTLTEIVKVAPTLPTIGKLIREGENPLKTIQTSLTLILTMYGYSSTDEEFTILTSTFMDNAKLLTIEDIKLFTKKCLAGDYNDKYKPKFQLHFLMEWLKEYKDERMLAAETMPTYKAMESQPLTEKSKEIINQILEHTKPKPSELVYSTDTSREEQQAKDLQKHLTKEFDYLWEKQGKNEFDRGRGKYVFHKAGSQMLPDYLRIRFKEIYEAIALDYTKNFKETGIPYQEFIFEQVNKICKE